MDRVEAYMQLDEASRRADILSRRLSDAATGVAYGNATVNWNAIEDEFKAIDHLIERVREWTQPKKGS